MNGELAKCRVLARACGLMILPMSLCAFANSQVNLPDATTDDNVMTESRDLPDAPTPSTDKTGLTSIFGEAPRPAAGTPAERFRRVIQPYELAESQSSGDKFKLSVMSRLTLSDVAGTLFSAGISHLRDSPPHFGTDSGAFGERLGALALKQTTQSIFNYGIYDSLFHDDPHYYVMGRQQNIGVRALYSVSRLVVTQTDDGRATINWPKFAAIASAIALTNLYYPARDHGFGHGASSFGVSLGTSILNNEEHEFIGDGLRLLRHHRN